MVGQQLHRNGVKNGRDEGVNLGDFNRPCRGVFQLGNALLVGNQQDLAAARDDFLRIRCRFFEQTVIRRNDDNRHVFVNQRDGAVFHLARCVTFGVDIGNFFQLQRAFKCDGIGRAAAEVKHVACLRNLLGHGLDFVVMTQQLRHAGRGFAQGVGQLLFTLRTDSTARAGKGDGQACQRGQLRGEGFGRCHADFGAGQRA